jgi:hypothetical protein
MRRVLAAVSFAMSLGITGAIAAPAFAQAKAAEPKVDPEVQKHFETANDLYKEGKYDDALVEYDAAYAAGKNWKILYNRGQCLVMVKREPDAIADFEKYLSDGADKVTPERKKQVETDIAKLKERLGTIVVTGAPAGSIVEIDGRPVSTLPATKPILAGAGNHEITVRPPGQGIPDIRKIQVVAGKENDVTVAFVATTPTGGGAPGPVLVGGALPPPPPQGFAGGGDVSPPPPPPSKKEPGGLVAPSFLLSLGLGGGVTTGNASDQSVSGAGNTARNARGVGLVDIAATWHPTPFWELGLFGGGGAGAYSIKANAIANSTGGTADPSNVGYAYSIFGLRIRIHPIRAKHFDGWLGFDMGRYGETWTATNGTTFNSNGPANGTGKMTGSALGLGLSLGADFPIDKRWALGGSFRYLSATQVQCDGDKSNCPASGNDRGVSEFMLRLTFAIPYGPAAAEPAAASSSLEPYARF